MGDHNVYSLGDTVYICSSFRTYAIRPPMIKRAPAGADLTEHVLVSVVGSILRLPLVNGSNRQVRGRSDGVTESQNMAVGSIQE